MAADIARPVRYRYGSLARADFAHSPASGPGGGAGGTGFALGARKLQDAARSGLRTTSQAVAAAARVRGSAQVLAGVVGPWLAAHRPARPRSATHASTWPGAISSSGTPCRQWSRS